LIKGNDITDAFTPAISYGGTEYVVGRNWWRYCVRLHLSTFGIHAVTQVANVNSVQQTVIPTPENRKVGGSTRTLVTYAKID
jgi:hypothetical protein